MYTNTYYQRFARADKRNKLPKWINENVMDASTNLSTDMAIASAKKFLRSMAQPYEANQMGVSLWSLKDIEAKGSKRAAVIAK